MFVRLCELINGVLMCKFIEHIQHMTTDDVNNEVKTFAKDLFDKS